MKPISDIVLRVLLHVGIVPAAKVDNRAKDWAERARFWRGQSQLGNEEELARACDALAQWHTQGCDGPMPVIPPWRKVIAPSNKEDQ
jgi:hypothetical protein